MAAVRRGELTLARAAEDVGGRTQALPGQGYTFGPAVARDGPKDAQGRGVAYVTIDATGTRPQNINRPNLVPILDFYHPASYLEKLAKALHPGAEAAATAQARQRCRLLKAEGGAVTLAVLRTRAGPARPSAAPRAAGGDAGVLRHQRASRGVPGVPGRGLARRQRGGGECLQDGGGAASQGGRPALAEDGAHALCHVRALYRSEEGQGQACWQRRFRKAANVQQRN